MADIDAAFVQQVFDISKRQRKTDVKHHRQTDNLTARFEIAKWIRFGHPARLRNHPARLKQFCSDSTVTDAIEFPLPIVKFDVFEERLGEGSYRQHSQRDHWRLIEEGLFEDEDLVIPSVGSGLLSAWEANYAPPSEAFGFLEDYGLGPDCVGASGTGLSFYEYGDHPEIYGPAVLVDDLFAASLLQESFIEKGIPVEILRQERGWIRLLDGNAFWRQPVSGANYFERLEGNEVWRRTRSHSTISAQVSPTS